MGLNEIILKRQLEAKRQAALASGNLSKVNYDRTRAIESGDPNEVLGQVLQGYWKDYKTNGLPLFNKLVGETTYGPNGQAVLDREITAGTARADTAINVANQNQQERLRGYGVSLSPEQEADNRRLQGLSRSATLTDTANRITQNLVDRNRAVATGGATQAIYRDQVTGGK